MCLRGTSPNDAAIVRLVGAILLKQNDEWAVCRLVREETMLMAAE